jgi:hypothetical protein
MPDFPIGDQVVRANEVAGIGIAPGNEVDGSGGLIDNQYTKMSLMPRDINSPQRSHKALRDDELQKNRKAVLSEYCL